MSIGQTTVMMLDLRVPSSSVLATVGVAGTGTASSRPRLRERAGDGGVWRVGDSEVAFKVEVVGFGLGSANKLAPEEPAPVNSRAVGLSDELEV